MRILKKVSVLAGLFTMVGTGAFAADLDIPPMKPAMDSGLYVRGDVGIGVHHTSGFSNGSLPATASFCGTCGSQSIADTPYLSAGIGMELGGHFRLEATAEYRSSADINGMDNYTNTAFDGSAGGTGAIDTMQSNTEYNGHVRSIVSMVNGYYDVFNFQGFTPYVGAGVGMAYNMVDDVNTHNISTVTPGAGSSAGYTEHTEFGHAQNASKLNLAYALMAGASFDISENGKLDLGYRYINLGSMTSGAINSCNTGCPSYGNLTMNDVAAHEMRVGVRWLLDN